jgi:hypothetical protein
MLQLRNGFYAFESALHVFPICSETVSGESLLSWNSRSSWRSDYGDLTQGLLFFAEDILQDQFCLSTSGVLRFNAETGGTKPMAISVEGWADVVLRDYQFETGWTFAKAWQTEHGPLASGKRLTPKQPFFMGGAYELENFSEVGSIEGMHCKAAVASQTRSLRNGTQVRLIREEKPAN